MEEKLAPCTAETICRGFHHGLISLWGKAINVPEKAWNTWNPSLTNVSWLTLGISKELWSDSIRAIPRTAFFWTENSDIVHWDCHTYHSCSLLLLLNHHYVWLVGQYVWLELKVPQDLSPVLLNHFWRCLPSGIGELAYSVLLWCWLPASFSMERSPVPFFLTCYCHVIQNELISVSKWHFFSVNHFDHFVCFSVLCCE